jgi:hypothetical protein
MRLESKLGGNQVQELYLKKAHNRSTTLFQGLENGW